MLNQWQLKLLESKPVQLLSEGVFRDAVFEYSTSKFDTSIAINNKTDLFSDLADELSIANLAKKNNPELAKRVKAAMAKTVLAQNALMDDLRVLCNEVEKACREAEKQIEKESRR
jgi:hypothetical protein